MTRIAAVVVAATILMLIVAAWRLLWRDPDAATIPTVRFAMFALLDLMIVALVAAMTPHLMPPVAVLLGVIGGIYLGRGWEQVKLAPTPPTVTRERAMKAPVRFLVVVACLMALALLAGCMPQGSYSIHPHETCPTGYFKWRDKTAAHHYWCVPPREGAST